MELSEITPISLPVHPHMRGVDRATRTGTTAARGSPPHAWGRFVAHCIDIAVYPVHPHMRGVDNLSAASIALIAGSPPHAWGRWQTDSRVMRWSRFTPTCVG